VIPLQDQVVFVLTKYNRNSIAALAGAIEVCESLLDLDVSFVWDQEGLASDVQRVTAGRRRVVVAFSFSTAYREQVAQRLCALQAAFGDHANRFDWIAGGPHPTGDPLGTLDMGFDVAVRGEGEETLPALLTRLRAGADDGNLPGIAYREGTKVALTPQAPPVDIEHYPPFSLKYNRWGFIEISRGCPWACRYCQTPQLCGTRMRHRSVAHLADAIRGAMRAGFSYARLITPNAFAYGSPDGRRPNLQAVEELLRTVSGLVGKDQTYFGSFPSEVRPDMVSPEAVALVKRFAANKTLLVGAQSGSLRMLKHMHRGHKVDDVYRAVEYIVGEGLVPSLDFIFGLPGETEEDRTETIRVIRDLADQGAIIHSHMFMPLPGTPWANMPAGVATPDIESLLGYLGQRGQHFGAWGRQQRLAHEQSTQRANAVRDSRGEGA